MKKKILRIALVLVLVGGILAAIGWALGGHTGLYWERGGLRTGPAAVRYEISENLDPFSTIDLTLGVGNVTLRQGESFRITGQHYGPIEYAVVDGHLLVYTPRHNTISFLRFRGGDSHITITVPSGTALQDVQLTLGVGNLRLERLELQGASLTSGVGNVYAQGLFTGNISADSGTGNVTLQLLSAREDVSYSITAGVGNITLNGQRQGGAMGNSLSRTAENPTASLLLNAGVGNVAITFSD